MGKPPMWSLRAPQVPTVSIACRPSPPTFILLVAQAAWQENMSGCPISSCSAMFWGPIPFLTKAMERSCCCPRLPGGDEPRQSPLGTDSPGL